MKYLIEMTNVDGRVVETVKFGDAGIARDAFADSRNHPFSAGSQLVSVSETGTRVTLEKDWH